uniref:Uncharacterized protein n=1 Tax=Candidatus Methanophaga sp. ANME-1 ERB7 TaxID=2759913 RepID=A0A7G9Z6L4_9EURY|nr:hypothetical protein FMLIDMBJ_00046 [Methanosarcinales archaeon ANME-1 ERB7]
MSMSNAATVPSDNSIPIRFIQAIATTMSEKAAKITANGGMIIRNATKTTIAMKIKANIRAFNAWVWYCNPNCALILSNSYVPTPYSLLSVPISRSYSSESLVRSNSIRFSFPTPVSPTRMTG